MHHRLNIAFFLLCMLLFVGVDFGADVIARNTVGNQAVAAAAVEHLHYAVIQPVAAALLAAPFMALAWLSIPLAQRRTPMAGVALTLSGVLLLGGLYFLGYHSAQVAMANHKWTAAAISVAFIPIESVPVLLLCAGIRWLILRRQPPASWK